MPIPCSQPRFDAVVLFHDKKFSNNVYIYVDLRCLIIIIIIRLLSFNNLVIIS